MAMLDSRPAVPPVLVADIGGTTTRFALAYPGGEIEDMSIVVHDSAATFEAAIERYLQDTKARPHAAVLAIAGPVSGDEIALTNRAWRFSLSGLKSAFGFGVARAINDFEALAWAIVGRKDCDFRPIGAQDQAGSGVKAVLGPGTGLGVAAIIPLENGGWHVVASEGGHVSFGPATPEEDAVFARIRERHGRLSAEALLSGPGLERLHVALAGDAQPLASHEIVRRAGEGDAAAKTTIDAFVRLLGRFAGDVALTFKALGGVYLAGGVGIGIADLMDRASFRAAFETHPPYAHLLAGIPTFMVACREPGLLGCAALAAQWVGEDYSI